MEEKTKGVSSGQGRKGGVMNEIQLLDESDVGLMDGRYTSNTTTED